MSDERKPKMPVIWPYAWGMLVLGWLSYLSFHTPDWQGVALGLMSGCILAAWAGDITGGKLPDFMVPPRGRRRP
ncbi:hypothetical protein [Azorhizobium caulinodans]|uniref:hypothetical protein n=1 Tax=Azorhizobium caulinodans TaxID=7 RepID=UPI00068A64E6|nr:hypothetical protein [Azorhizobium caulinodans]